MFSVGFDTQAFTLSMIIHQLVKHDEVQDKLLAEIDEALEDGDGFVSYGLIDKLTYLDMVIRESMRCPAPGFYRNKI